MPLLSKFNKVVAITTLATLVDLTTAKVTGEVSLHEMAGVGTSLTTELTTRLVEYGVFMAGAAYLGLREVYKYSNRLLQRQREELLSHLRNQSITDTQ